MSDDMFSRLDAKYTGAWDRALTYVENIDNAGDHGAAHGLLRSEYPIAGTQKQLAGGAKGDGLLAPVR